MECDGGRKKRKEGRMKEIKKRWQWSGGWDHTYFSIEAGSSSLLHRRPRYQSPCFYSEINSTQRRTAFKPSRCHVGG